MDKLKKANEDIWNRTIEINEKVFRKEGIREVLNLVPPQVMKLPDIKYSLNELNEESKGSLPKPKLNLAGCTEKPKPKIIESTKQIDFEKVVPDDEGLDPIENKSNIKGIF